MHWQYQLRAAKQRSRQSKRARQQGSSDCSSISTSACLQKSTTTRFLHPPFQLNAAFVHWVLRLQIFGIQHTSAVCKKIAIVIVGSNVINWPSNADADEGWVWRHLQGRALLDWQWIVDYSLQVVSNWDRKTLFSFQVIPNFDRSILIDKQIIISNLH